MVAYNHRKIKITDAHVPSSSVWTRRWDPGDVWEVARILGSALQQKIPLGALGDFSARQMASELLSTLIGFGFLLVIRESNSPPWGEVGK